MYIYHVIGTVSGYDTYSDFVCIASSAERAQNMFPSMDNIIEKVIFYNHTDNGWYDDAGNYDVNNHGSWDSDPSTVKVILLGMADSSNNEEKVICASFHAG